MTLGAYRRPDQASAAETHGSSRAAFRVVSVRQVSAIAQALRHVAQLRQETLSKVTGPLTDAEFALIIGPLLFQAVIARRPVTGKFLDELAAARAARSDR
jgi:hypothetical protein